MGFFLDSTREICQNYILRSFERFGIVATLKLKALRARKAEAIFKPTMPKDTKATHQLVQQVHLTKEGRDEIALELKTLKEEKLPQAIERVARARDFGDLTENAEYHSAREDLSFIEGKIEELEALLAHTKLIAEQPKTDVVKLGSTVTVNGNGQSHIFSVVGEWEADPVNKKISHKSPLGQALVGKKVHDKVEIDAPAGKILYTIVKIH